jgi:hypothetical protein
MYSFFSPFSLLVHHDRGLVIERFMVRVVGMGKVKSRVGQRDGMQRRASAGGEAVLLVRGHR